MANKNAKVKKNVPGTFYVDDTCISCGQCTATAPANFKEDGESGLMYVAVQPVSDDALKACQEALDNCPVSAIGKDEE